MKKVLIPTKLDKIAQDILKANGHYVVHQDDGGDVAALAGALGKDESAVRGILEDLRLKGFVRGPAGSGGGTDGPSAASVTTDGQAG